VNFIFSDKTGTLTCNKMLLKYLVIGDTCYEYNAKLNKQKKEVNVKSKGKGNNEFIQDDIQEIDSNYFINLVKKRPNSVKYDFNVIRSNANENLSIRLDTDNMLVKEFWKNLASCHECIIDEKENGVSSFSVNFLLN
jgi:magnesium-transporting ATPase (P-type)